MTERWPEVSAILDDVLDLPRAARADAVARLAPDPALRAQVFAFLDAADAADAFLTGGAPDTIDPAAPVGARFGAWEVTGALGRGGMGEVFAVRRIDGGFEQVGALKRVARAGEADRARFRTERQLLARLDHPGVARVLDGGLAPDGDAWMVMERIDGAPIDRYCEDHRLDLADRARLVLVAADALAAAHARLILHRDLKPSNVLVDDQGRPKLIDFGIAKQMGVDAEATAGPLPVSAPWAAPELLTGAPVGPATDVYGLAALLYELAAGEPPVRVRGLPAALAVGRVLDATPTPLRALTTPPPALARAPAALVGDLDAVLGRALRKEAADRYPTVEAFAEDLRRAVAGEAVSARAGERGYQARRFVRQHRGALAAAAAVALSLIGGAGVALWQARVAVAARDAAVIEADRSEAVRQSLFLLLGEASDAAGPEGSRKDVLDRAGARLTREFERDPARYGPIMRALGELYFHANDYPGAAALLAPLTAAAPGAVAEDVAADARNDLAQIKLRTGQPEEARALLADAQAFWRRDPETWRAELNISRLTEAQLRRDVDGDPAGAADLLRGALTERIAMSGAANREVGVLQNNLAVTLQAAGDLPGAEAALVSARETWAAIGAADSPDALNTLNNLGAIQTLTGRGAEAAAVFAEAVRVRRALFGPSAALGALVNNQGKSLLAAGDPAAALPLLREAADLAVRYGAEGGTLHVSALAGVAEAEVGIGASEAALVTAERALTLARGQAEPAPPAVAVATVALARAAAHAGDADRARALLAEADTIVAALGPAGARIGKAIAEVRATWRL